ncbi:competence/damage-inducible protein A [Candidatus Poribacteria bacterium]|nr:competence/damage-inducible protein A [Candidatus Poribacteria bacterium]
MRGELIFVGTELLLGQIVNTNAAYLGENLARLGVDLYYSSVIGDNLERIKNTTQTALSRSELVIITGGLGPTFDDITREGIATAINRELVYDPEVMAQIEAHFNRVKYNILPMHRRQAYVFKTGCQVVPNPVGSAPGLIIEVDGKWIIAMPGVPREMERMCNDTIFPWITKRAGKGIIKSRVLKVCGMGESTVADALNEIVEPLTNPTIAFLARPNEVSVRITAKANDSDEADRMIAVVADQIRTKLEDNVFSEDNQTMEEVIGCLLVKNLETLAIAESCTGGLVSDRITDISGSSRYFQGSVIAYSNNVKSQLLNVSESDLEQYGAVSSTVALQMAKGVRKLLNTDYGLGITGIAGPTGETPDKPVGLVYIAVASDKRNNAREFRFLGERTTIKRRASQMALDMLRRELLIK